MIAFNQVSTGYGKRIVVKDISFTAESGAVTVLLGKNGCGKSTLVRAASGNLSYSGSITLDGAEVKSLRPKVRARLIAVMPQLLLSPEITVRELVSYGRQPYTGISGILSEKDKALVEDMLCETGIESIADARIDKISGGERQKAYFAALLAQTTDNLMLDEPGAFLDAEYMNNLCSLLLSAKAKGKTVLTVMHDVNRALEIADRLVVIDQSVVFKGDSKAFISEHIAERFFSLKRFDCIDNAGEQVALYR